MQKRDKEKEHNKLQQNEIRESCLIQNIRTAGFDISDDKLEEKEKKVKKKKVRLHLNRW